MTYIAPYWSPSRFMAWQQCPQEFYRRYILRQPVQPTEAMHFGTAVHRGLEVHFRGEDGELAFRRTWRQLTDELQSAGISVSGALGKMGLELVEKVTDLGLSGEPERKIWMRTDDILGAPTLGYVDLWSPDLGTIFDFKTTVGSWSAERAQKEQHQPCAYSYAYWLEYDELPEFEYIVLNRITGRLDRFKTRRTQDQIWDWFTCCWQISEDARNERFDCRCMTGVDCPECGSKWEHGHVCDMAKGLRIRLGEVA